MLDIDIGIEFDTISINEKNNSIRFRYLIPGTWKFSRLCSVRRVCGFRVKVWESYRTSRSFGYGHGSVTELTEVPAGYKNCCTRTPGIVTHGVQNSQKFRVRV